MNRRAFFGVIGAALVAAKCPAVPLHRAASFGNRFPQMGTYIAEPRYGRLVYARFTIPAEAIVASSKGGGWAAAVRAERAAADADLLSFLKTSALQ